MLPYASLFPFVRNRPTPVYRQLATGIVTLIQRGQLAPGTQLPSTHALSQQVRVHRQTVVMAYSELQTQGWVDSRARRGLYVATHLPIVTPQPRAEPAPTPAYAL